MHGVSEVIAIILILMITISLAGLAYMFMSTTMADVTSSAGSTVDTTTSSMLTSFTIESMDVAKVYVRNTGQNALTSLSVYVNDELATYNVTTPIASGAVGTITIYSFIPDGATVKVTSPSGFSTSKVARPCEKAVGCWKFDEGSGTSAFDSSPYSNTGTLTNGPTWTSGKYGNGIQFDGTNDHIVLGNSSILNPRTSITLSAMFKVLSHDRWQDISSKENAFIIGVYTSDNILFEFNTGSAWRVLISGTDSVTVNEWHYLVVSYSSGDRMRIYIDGLLVSQSDVFADSINLTNKNFLAGYGHAFNGTIDEVRIYNRAIY